MHRSEICLDPPLVCSGLILQTAISESYIQGDPWSWYLSPCCVLTLKHMLLLFPQFMHERKNCISSVLPGVAFLPTASSVRLLPRVSHVIRLHDNFSSHHLKVWLLLVCFCFQVGLTVYLLLYLLVLGYIQFRMRQ